MRILLAIGLIALPLSAFAATTSDTAEVTLTIDAYGVIDLLHDFDSFTNTDPTDTGSAVDVQSCTIKTNDEAWTAAFAIADKSTPPVANRVNNGTIDTMPAAVDAVDELKSGGTTGNSGVTGNVTVTITRSGLSDANGTYSGTVTGTLTYD